MPERETHLALVKERYTNVRANVTFHGLDARMRGRVQVSAELPPLYPLGRAKTLPEIVYPDAANDVPTDTRSRIRKLEEDPFLATLPVDRHRGKCRQVGRRCITAGRGEQCLTQMAVPRRDLGAG